MKTINETFTDKEIEQLKAIKGAMSWHDIIMIAIISYGKAKPKTNLYQQIQPNPQTTKQLFNLTNPKTNKNLKED